MVQSFNHSLKSFLLHYHFIFLYVGYHKYYKALAEFLNQQSFASDIEFQPIKDEGTTGNFEVTILETNQLIHSNKKGMGKCNTSTAMNAVALQIEDALEEM